MNKVLFILGCLILLISFSENFVPLLFTIVFNNITDINDPDFTGGFRLIFTPFAFLYK